MYYRLTTYGDILRQNNYQLSKKSNPVFGMKSCKRSCILLYKKLLNIQNPLKYYTKSK